MFYISTLENKYAFIKTWKAKFKFKFLEFPTTMHQNIEIQGEQPGPGSLSPAFSSTRDHTDFQVMFQVFRAYSRKIQALHSIIS